MTTSTLSVPAFVPRSAYCLAAAADLPSGAQVLCLMVCGKARWMTLARVSAVVGEPDRVLLEWSNGTSSQVCAEAQVAVRVKAEQTGVAA